MTKYTRFGVGSGLVILAVLFMFSASLSGQATAPALATNVAVAGPDRPPQVPDGYVVTPFGYFHPSCVFEIEDGARLLADGRVEHTDGTVDARVPVCGYPHYTATGLLVTEDLSGAIGRTPAINGWLEYVSTTTTTSYNSIEATWVVPPLPASDAYQILFFFPGFQDVNNVLSIVQPVLQWYAPGPSWAVASWNCCMQGTVWESHPLKVSPGDTILGKIYSRCKKGLNYCADWRVISEDETIGKKTILNKTPAEGQVWNWAFSAVLEVYGVRDCSDFPANNTSTVFTVQLYDQNKQLISNPGWIGTPAPTGTDPDCNYGLNVTDTQETLEY
jgi:hypothetical protein